MVTDSLYSVTAVRALEQSAESDYAISVDSLMARAGAAAFHCLKLQWPAAKRLVVVAGAGNNGGDGYVLAHLALQENFDVTVIALTPIEQLPPLAQRVAAAAIDGGVEIHAFSAELLSTADVIVDGIFGIGLRDAVPVVIAEIIQKINQTRLPILALDVPSGLNAETGHVTGVAVQAWVTISFIALKKGLFTGSAKAVCGKVILADLDLPKALLNSEDPCARLLRYGNVKKMLIPRAVDTHKGDFGHVLIIGGDHGMAGAVCLAAFAALRSGAGLVSVATQPQHVMAMVTAHPEVMTHGIRTAADLLPLLARASVVAIGPGLGQSEWSRTLLTAALKTPVPLVIDADALTLLAQHPERRDDWILTPHPGEAARLLALPNAAAIQVDRFQASNALQKRYGGVVILKGAGSLVSDGEQTWVAVGGNPGMASAGMGDVLTGITASFVAQKYPLAMAAQLAVAVHAEAGDRVALAQGERGMVASDLIQMLSHVVNA